MRRVLFNGWWTLVIALVLGAGWVASSPTAAWCGSGTLQIGDPGGQSGTPGSSGSTGIGDPDDPTSARRAAYHGASYGVGSGSTSVERSGLGSSAAPGVSLIVKIRVALEGLRLYFLRF